MLPVWSQLSKKNNKSLINIFIQMSQSSILLLVIEAPCYSGYCHSNLHPLNTGAYNCTDLLHIGQVKMAYVSG
jgi:hypothetical protein